MQVKFDLTDSEEIAYFKILLKSDAKYSTVILNLIVFYLAQNNDQIEATNSRRLGQITAYFLNGLTESDQSVSVTQHDQKLMDKVGLFKILHGKRIYPNTETEHDHRLLSKDEKIALKIAAKE